MADWAWLAAWLGRRGMCSFGLAKMQGVGCLRCGIETCPGCVDATAGIPMIIALSCILHMPGVSFAFVGPDDGIIT